VLASFFWIKDVIVLVEDLLNGATITAKYYVPLLDKIKQRLAPKRQRKLCKGILLLRDNAVPHRAAIPHQKLTDLSSKVLKHPAYSNYLTPSD
jgi:hypothetical protein